MKGAHAAVLDLQGCQFRQCVLPRLPCITAEGRQGYRYGFVGVGYGPCVATPSPPASVDPEDIARSVLTQHNDSMRTGAYLVETQLTPDSVDPTRRGPGMALQYSRQLDGNVWAQLLYARRVPTVRAGEKNLIFAFTDQNTVYAYDAPDPTATEPIWCTKLPLDSDPTNPCSKPPLNPNINPNLTKHNPTVNSAITVANSTPVIDLLRHTLFVVYGIANDDFSDAEFHLAKLDIRSGAVLKDVRIGEQQEGKVSSRFFAFQVEFKPTYQLQRAGLLLAPNPLEAGRQTVYVAFGANTSNLGGNREESRNYHGWVIGYDADTLEPRGVFCSTPDRIKIGEGGGIWQGGAGLAADEAGNIYFSTGNGPGSGDAVTGDMMGPFLDSSDASPDNHGNSIIKLTPMRDMNGRYYFDVRWFSAAAEDRKHAYEWEHEAEDKSNPALPLVGGNDIDLGAGGVTVIPASTQVVGGGKTGVLYVIDSKAMRKLQGFDAFYNDYIPCPPSKSNPNDPQDGCRYGGNPQPPERPAPLPLNPDLWDPWQIGPHLHGAPTYWQVSPDTGYLFLWGEKDYLKRFTHDRLSGLIIADLDHTEFGNVRALGEDLPERPGSWVMPGGLISLSANGTKDGILWITLPGQDRGRIFAVLAENPLPHRAEQPLLKLWEDENVPKNLFFSKNNPPTVADGQMFLGTRDGKILVYGLGKPLVHLPPVIVPVARIDPVPSIEKLLRQLSAPERAGFVPPQGQHPFSLASLSGTVTYEVRSPAPGSPVAWTLASITGELKDESGVRPNIGYDGLGTVLATVDHGLTWTAPDGGQMTWSIEKSVRAPEAGNAPWVLFRSNAAGAPDVSASILRDLPTGAQIAPVQSGGVLAAVTYVQQLGTESGAPPKSKAGVGDRVDVPFTATYAFYVAETENNNESDQPN